MPGKSISGFRGLMPLSCMALLANIASAAAENSGAEMLGQLQPLRLIVGANALAVHGVGPRQHFLVDEAADDLAVLEDERHFAQAHFQHRARSLAAGAGIAEAGIE